MHIVMDTDQFLKIFKWAGCIAIALVLAWRLPEIIGAFVK